VFWFSCFVFANGLLLALLAANVSRVRIAERVPHGDGDRLPLKKAIRAHGNGVEHTTIYALCILALALAKAPPVLQATLVVGFTLVRLAHALAMLRSLFQLRRVAAFLTYLFELAAVGAVLAYGVLA
jgi:uncharacterized membrane protein YecN with MAPEG domain